MEEIRITWNETGNIQQIIINFEINKENEKR